MIDLIIPYYKNYNGLVDTLESINYNIFKVIIVQDGFEEFPVGFDYDVEIVWYMNNRGPGYAREYGIKHTFNEYLAFIDAGDIFISKEIQEKIPQIIEENQPVDVFSWLYYYKDELSKHTDNRLHGKIYKRAFLEKYNIEFSSEGSYLNEDVGFNRSCRLLTEFKYIDEPIIKWIEDENSLTQKNNRESHYKDQTLALSINMIHAIENCRRFVNVTTEINQIAIALYYWFLRTTIDRPQFTIEAWDGARIFYLFYEQEIVPSNLFLGNPEVKKCLALRSKLKFPINILNFTKEMQHCKKCPDYYLTFSEI